MTVFLTRLVRFNAAHRYHRPDWSAERNAEVFGACNNPVGHGHNYQLEAMVAGEPDAETGFCVDLGMLDDLLKTEVIRPLDHQHLNHVVPEFADGRLVPTTENIVILLWKRIAPRIPLPARLVRLRLREDVDLFVDCYGAAASEAAEDPRWRLREV